MAMAFKNIGFPVDLCNGTIFFQDCFISAKAHCASKIALFSTFFQSIPFKPFCHQTNDRLVRGTKFGRRSIFDTAEITCSLYTGHLHTKAYTKKRNFTLASKTNGHDLAFGTTFAESTGNKNAMHFFEIRRRVFFFENFRFYPLEIDFDLIGKTAMG